MLQHLFKNTTIGVAKGGQSEIISLERGIRSSLNGKRKQESGTDSRKSNRSLDHANLMITKFIHLKTYLLYLRLITLTI